MAAFLSLNGLDYVLIFRVRDPQGYAVRKFFLSCVIFNVGLKSWLTGRLVMNLWSSCFFVTALFAAAVNLEIRPVNFEDVFPSIAHRF